MDLVFPPIEELDTDDDLVGIGGELTVANLLNAYSSGYFPMPVEGTIGWFSPVLRSVMEPGEATISKSTAKSAKKFTTTMDQCFSDVVEACGDPKRPHGWITPEILTAYTALHEQGHAHSFEVWQDNNLVGGLYGVQIGSLFAAESKFHRETDASKVAVADLVNHLDATIGNYLIDSQWLTPHLASLGFKEVTRSEYSKMLRRHTS